MKTSSILAWAIQIDRRPGILQKSLLRWPYVKIRIVIPCLGASLDYAWPLLIGINVNFDVEIDPESEAIVTIGSKEGLAHLTLATLCPGDAVLVANPAYPIHAYGCVIAGADVIYVPLVEDLDFFSEWKKRFRIPGRSQKC